MSPVNPIDVAARPAALAASLRAHLGAVAWTRVLQVGALGAEQGADVCLVGMKHPDQVEANAAAASLRLEAAEVARLFEVAGDSGN